LGKKFGRVLGILLKQLLGETEENKLTYKLVLSLSGPGLEPEEFLPGF
jgi:hypothetical protein